MAGFHSPNLNVGLRVFCEKTGVALKFSLPPRSRAHCLPLLVKKTVPAPLRPTMRHFVRLLFATLAASLILVAICGGATLA
jgi:hypothetical protein